MLPLAMSTSQTACKKPQLKLWKLRVLQDPVASSGEKESLNFCPRVTRSHHRASRISRLAGHQKDRYAVQTQKSQGA